MFIHRSACISPQHTFLEIDIEQVNPSIDNVLRVLEPKYEDIPLGILRRMGKAVRLGVGAALPLVKTVSKIDGIIIGTANGGMEDCIKFLNQIVQYEEGGLTPTNFVQSTTNAVAAQIGLITHNTGYNITHVHRGLAFENAVIDVMMLLKEHPQNTYLLGGLDEISDYNYNIEFLADAYKNEAIDNHALYNSNTKGSIAGEGVAMFLITNKKENALAKVTAVKTLHTPEPKEVAKQLKVFIRQYLPEGETIDLYLSGENGDMRLNEFYEQCVAIIDESTGIARFKHFFGEFPAVSALSLWLACEFLNEKELPIHFIKKEGLKKDINRILIYNTCKGEQHGFWLIEK